MPLGRILVNTHRMRTNALLCCIGLLAGYMLVFDKHTLHIPDDVVDYQELEQELDSGNVVHLVTYKSPLDENLFRVPPNEDDLDVENEAQNKSDRWNRRARRRLSDGGVARFRRVWTMADQLITGDRLFSDTPEVEVVLDALSRARVVGVDILDIGEYESGTAEKWLLTLEGGQKAMAKIVWEEKGGMKRGSLCNYGFEQPSAEIAAFHLHRILGFYNTPYVTGRVLDLRQEVLPVSTPAIMRHFVSKPGNVTCIVDNCLFCKEKFTMCPHDGLVEVSLAYWIPRKMKVHTYPPNYMPFSTPYIAEWIDFGLNNRTYCDKVRGSAPYDIDRFYYDLFDFAVVDSMMYHYDSKHYTINDNTSAEGLPIRIDHGRAFCSYDHDEDKVFLAPITQCCTLRKSTYENLKAVQGGLLTKRLRAALDKDPIAPVLQEVWYPALERRLRKVLEVVDKCIHTNGGAEHVLVVDS